MRHGNDTERFNAADILRGLGVDAESAVPIILEVMRQDEDVCVRAQCAFAMIDLAYALRERAAFAVPPLIEALLTDPDAETRSLAASALAAIPTAIGDSVPALRQALHDEHEWVRDAARDAMAALGA